MMAGMSLAGGLLTYMHRYIFCGRHGVSMGSSEGSGMLNTNVHFDAPVQWQLVSILPNVAITWQ